MNWQTKIIVLVALMICFSVAVEAQQLPLHNQYFVNPYTLSPAAAGYNFTSQVFVGYRKQWTGMPQSPQTSFASIVIPFKRRVWFGAEVISDQSSIFRNFYGLLSYTFQLKLAPKNYLRFSLWGSVFQNSINLQNINVVDTDDPLLQNKSQLVGTAFNAGTGIMYQNNSLVLGISLPNLFVNNKSYAIESNNNLIVIERQIIAFGWYNFYIKNRWALKPGFVFRSTKNSPVSFDIYAILEFEKKVFAGMLYRKGTILGVLVGGYVMNSFTVCYTFEFLNNGFTRYTSGTHEISIGYDLKIGKRYLPRRFQYYPMNLEYNPKYRHK